MNKVRIDWHNGSHECAVWFECDIGDHVRAIMMQFLSVHAMESGQVVSLTLNGTIWEGGYDDSGELRAFVDSHCRRSGDYVGGR